MRTAFLLSVLADEVNGSSFLRNACINLNVHAKRSTFEQMPTFRSLLAASTLALVVCLAGPFRYSASGSEYTFATIETTNTVELYLGEYPVLDEQGRVTYSRTTMTTSSMVRTSPDLNGRDDVIAPGQVRWIFSRFGSNAAGDVGFIGYVADVPRAYRAHDGKLEPVSDILEIPKFAAINDAGVVTYNDFDVGVYTSLDPTQALWTPAAFESYYSQPTINNAGQILINNDYSAAPFVGLLSLDGSLNPFAQVGDTFGAFSRSNDLNDQGAVIFAAAFNSGPSLGAVLIWQDGVFTTVIDDQSPFVPSLAVEMAINNHNNYVIRADLSSGERGLYTGSDPIADKVIQTGDPLDGSFVDRIIFGNAFNDAGQIAFAAYLADGRFGIFRADPVVVPEPSALALGALGTVAVAIYGWRRGRKSRRESASNQ